MEATQYQMRFDLGFEFDRMDQDSIQLRFEEFHRRNPHVYEALVDLARDLRRAGRSRLGIKMLWEVLRWQLLRESAVDHLTLDNDFHSRYARLIMLREPDLDGIFETSRLRSVV